MSVLDHQARWANSNSTAFRRTDALKLQLNHVGMFTASWESHQQHCITPTATPATQHSLTKETHCIFNPSICLKIRSEVLQQLCLPNETILQAVQNELACQHHTQQQQTPQPHPQQFSRKGCQSKLTPTQHSQNCSEILCHCSGGQSKHTARSPLQTEGCH